MKVSELDGAQLDYWVAKAIGLDAFYNSKASGYCHRENEGDEFGWQVPHYSTGWLSGGPLIEERDIGVQPFDEILGVMVEEKDDWFASCGDETQGVPYHAFCGSTPLIAAMRCIVASKYGEEVDDD